MPHLGVRTRSMAATRSSCSTASNPKRRKLFSSADSGSEVVTPCPRPRRRLVTTPENSIAVSLAGEDRCSAAGTSSDHSASSASCCSNNVGSSEKNITREFSDLEDDKKEEEEESVEFKTSASYSCSTSRKCKKEQTMTRSPSSEIQYVELFDDLDSPVKSPSSEANSGRRPTVVKKMAPFQAEIDEFFDAAEKSVQKHFADKYNFDFEKEEPLTEGRYEWIRKKP